MSSTRRHYSDSRTNLPEPTNGGDEEAEETKAKIRLVRFQLSLECQLQTVCQDLLQIYKESRDWTAVSQLAQNLITNSQRISQLKEQLFLSAQSESSSPAPNPLLLDSIQELEADQEGEGEPDHTCEATSSDQEKPVKLSKVETPPTPTTTQDEEENIEEIKEAEVVTDYSPSEEPQLLEFQEEALDSQKKEVQQTDSDVISNNSGHPALAIDVATEQSPSPDLEVESSEDEFQTPDETTPERSTETSDLLSLISKELTSEIRRGLIEEEVVEVETTISTEVGTPIDHSSIEDHPELQLEDELNFETQETLTRDCDKTPTPKCEAPSCKEVTPERGSSEGHLQPSEDTPGPEIDPRQDLTLQIGSSVISEGTVPKPLGDDLVKQGQFTAEPADQLEQSGSTISLSGELLEVDKLLAEINQQEFTVESVQPVLVTPSLQPVANEGEDPDLNITNEEFEQVTSSPPLSVTQLVANEGEDPDLNITNEEFEQVTSSPPLSVSEPVANEREDPDLNITNEKQSPSEMDSAAPMKYAVSKVVEPQSGQIYYQISKNVNNETSSSVPPVLHTLEEFHALTEALKLDPFALDISYPNSEMGKGSTTCTNYENLTAFLNRVADDSNLCSEVKFLEFLSETSTTVPPLPGKEICLDSKQSTPEAPSQQPSLNGCSEVQAIQEDGSTKTQPKSLPDQEGNTDTDNVTSQVVVVLPQRESEEAEVTQDNTEGGSAHNGEECTTELPQVDPDSRHEDSISACTTPDMDAITVAKNEDQEGTIENQSQPEICADSPELTENRSSPPTLGNIVEQLTPPAEDSTDQVKEGTDPNTSYFSPSNSDTPSTASSSTNLATDESSSDVLITRSESNPALGGFDNSASVTIPDVFMSLQPLQYDPDAEKSASSENILQTTKSRGGKVRRQGSVPSVFAHSAAVMKQRGQKLANRVRIAKTGGKHRTSTLQPGNVSLQKVTPTMEWDPTCLLEELYSDRRQGVATKASLSGEVARHFGYLEKLPVNSSKPTVMKGYKRRYFRAMEGKLYYYEDRKVDKALGFAKLTNSRLVLIPKKCQLQVVEKNGKFIMLKAANNEELNSWHRSLKLEAAHPTMPAPLSPTAISINPVLIIDVGACSVRAGFSSEEPYPEIFFPAVCSLDAATLEPLDCGNNALLPGNRYGAHLVYPRKVSMRMDKSDSFLRLRAYQCIVDTVVGLLNVQPQSCQVILTLSPTVPEVERNDLAELLFETFAFSAVSFQEQALLALYSYNTTSGIIVDIGDHIDIVPIIDGYTIEAGITRLPFGGNAITESLSKLITSKGIRYFSETEQYINRFIKESICFVSQNFAEDSANCESNPTEYLRGVDVDRFHPPDLKKMIHLDVALFRAPEGLFDPTVWGKDVQGIHEYIWKTIQACPIDHRKDLAKNIYLSGATTLLPGLKERLQMEISALAPQGTTVTVFAGPSRQHAAYLGASVLASLGSFQKILVTQEEWGSVGLDALKKWAATSSV